MDLLTYQPTYFYYIDISSITYPGELISSTYYIKLKSCPSAFFPHQADNSVVSAWIDARLARNKKAICSGICKFISKSSDGYSFSTPVHNSHLCRAIQPLTTVIQCKIGNVLNCDTLAQWLGIQSLQVLKFLFASVVSHCSFKKVYM